MRKTLRTAIAAFVAVCVLGLGAPAARAGFVCWNPGAIKVCPGTGTCQNTGNVSGATYGIASLTPVTATNAGSAYSTVSFPSSPDNHYMAQGEFTMPMDMGPSFTSFVLQWTSGTTTVTNNVEWCTSCTIRTPPLSVTTQGETYFEITGDAPNDVSPLNCLAVNNTMSCCTAFQAGSGCGALTTEACGTFHPFGSNVNTGDQYSTITTGTGCADSVQGTLCSGTACQGHSGLVAFLRNNTVATNDGAVENLISACGFY